MGFFPGMVKAPAAGFASYLIQVNTLGECVIQRLTDDGTSDAFVVVPSVEQLALEIARTFSPRAVVHMFRGNRDLVRAWAGGEFATWGSVASELNRKPRRRAGVILEYLWRHTHSLASIGHNSWTHEFFRLDLKTKTFAVTDAGRAFDAKFFPPKEPT